MGEGGRQAAGGGGKNLFSPVFSKPRSSVSKLRSRALACCVTVTAQSACSGRKERLPPSGRGQGNRKRREARQRVRMRTVRGSLTPSRGEPNSAHPWSQRRQNCESPRDLT